MVFIDADVAGRSASAILSGDVPATLGLSNLSTTGFVSVEEFSSCSAIDVVRLRSGEGGGREKFVKDMLTKESSGLPSISGSGREPNRELFEADLARVPAVKEPFGDIMNPAGE